MNLVLMIAEASATSVAEATLTSERLLLLGMGGLVTVVGILFAQTQIYHRTTTQKLGECETDRAKLWEKVADLSGDVAACKRHMNREV